MSFEIPFCTQIKQYQRILIAGAGGGFDIFSGLPLYFALKALGKDLILANLSFTSLEKTNAKLVHPKCWEVTDLSQGSEYFPEHHLCYWFSRRGTPIPSLYAFDGGSGVVPLLESYRWLVNQFQIEAIILVDGGTDSLMCGNEVSLGSPTEDVTSIAAVSQLNLPSYLLCLGFGVDFFHGISHAQCFEAIADLAKSGGYLGAYSLVPPMPGVAEYRDAVEYLNNVQPQQSIVCNSIFSALEGQYGDHHRIRRTRGSKLWINPLMSIYWCFSLAIVAKRLLFFDKIQFTLTWAETMTRIGEFRKSITPKPWESIPI
ncbi:MAG: DUF1152 domain-containing protein [Planctomycetota bacterium]